MPTTAAICWAIHPDGSRSVIDFLEMPVTLWEAPHYYNRYWGQHGVHEGPIDFSPRYDTPTGPFYPFLRRGATVSFTKKPTAPGEPK